MKKDFEAIIIGGSYAGLSAAMALGRASRNVLVIDSGQPCNAPTPHSHNFLTRDGETPAAIAAIAKEQVQHYPTVKFQEGTVTGVEKTGDAFAVKLADSAIFLAKKVLLATGIKDIMPGIEGFGECWGKSVIHCPYCHGYEVKGLKTAVLANGDAAMHYALLLRQWTVDMTFFTNGPATFTGEQRAKLDQHNIAVVETPIKKLIQHSGKLEQIVLSEGTLHDIPLIYYKPDFELPGFVQKLNVETDDFGFIKVDDMMKTSADGIYAAGDCMNMMRAVSNAVATGNKAGAIINRDLSAESF
ncbi:MAG: NAD(P)/FAD-dependent oxidoreductase [Flavobacterium sp.]